MSGPKNGEAYTHDLYDELANYKIEDNKLVDQLTEDGNLLLAPLKRLPMDSKAEEMIDVDSHAQHLEKNIKQYLADILVQQTGLNRDISRHL